MGDRRNPIYDGYDIPYPPGQWSNASQQSSQYPSSVGQYLPGQGSPPHEGSSCVHTNGAMSYYNGYNNPTTAPYAPLAPTASVVQQIAYPPIQPTPTQSSHQSRAYPHSHSSQSQQYTQPPYAPSSQPQPHLSSHSRSHSQVHGYSPGQNSSQAPAHQQEEQYQAPFAQTISISPQYPASPSRPFACDMCALSFSRAHDLRRHRETHTGEKPFPCNGGCGKTFSRKDAMRRHQLVKQCGKIEEAWP